jgi:signal transduction histidine kinase
MIEQAYPYLILSGATIFAVLLYLWRQAGRAGRLQLALIRLNEEHGFDLPDFLRGAWPLLSRAGLRGLAWRLDWFGVPIEAQHGAAGGPSICRTLEVGDMRVAVTLYKRTAGAERRYFDETVVEIFMLLLRTDMWIKAGATDAAFTQVAKLTLFLQHDMKNIAQFIQLMGDQLAAIPHGKEQQALDYLCAAVPLIRHRADRIVTSLTGGGADARARNCCLHDELVLLGKLYGLDCDIRGDATLPCGEQALSSALDNILKNYRDHAAGPPLRIDIGMAGGMLLVTLEAPGQPLPARFERLFEPFWSSDPNGLGIGLYQAKQVLEGAGGSLEARAGAAGGLQFRLRCPRTAGRAPAGGDAGRVAGARQAGVTVFEAAIGVLVAGLVWAGALQAQAMFDRALARTLAAEMQDVADVSNAYLARHGAVPGDDDKAATRFAGAISAQGTSSGDGRINKGRWTGGSAGSSNNQEPALFWNHVRLAGLAKGDPLTLRGYNAVRGVLGISGASDDMPVPPANLRGNFTVCSGKIDGHIASMMDLQLDDGDATRGKLWAAAETNGEPVVTERAPTPYVDARSYTVCILF